MSVTFELFAPCVVCGCPAPCPECKGPVASEYRMYLSPESRRAVEAVRGRLRERTAA